MSDRAGPRPADGSAADPTSRRVRVTGAGRGLAVASGGALLLAWFGAGPVFAVTAALGGALLAVACLATRIHARGLCAVSVDPPTATARESFPVTVTLRNAARRAAAWDVLVVLRGPRGDRTRVGALVERLGPAEERAVVALHPPLARGVHRLGVLELETSFPFGLASAHVRFALDAEVLVLPRLGTFRLRVARPQRRGSAASYGAAGRGDEQEIHGLRPWREGESLRPVHWKASARRGRRVAREFRSEPRPPVHVILATGTDARRRSAAAAFETAVSLAATAVEHHLRRDHRVRLTLLGASPRTLTALRGRAGLAAALRELALVAAEPCDGAPALDGALAAAQPGERTFVIHVDGRRPDDDGAAALTWCDAGDRREALALHAPRRPGRAIVGGAAR